MGRGGNNINNLINDNSSNIVAQRKDYQIEIEPVYPKDLSADQFASHLVGPFTYYVFGATNYDELRADEEHFYNRLNDEDYKELLAVDLIDEYKDSNVLRVEQGEFGYDAFDNSGGSSAIYLQQPLTEQQLEVIKKRAKKFAKLYSDDDWCLAEGQVEDFKINIQEVETVTRNV